MKHILTVILVAAMSLSAGAASVELPSPQPAEKTPYSTVAAYLNPGGEAYFYLGTKQWCSQLDAMLGQVEGLLEVIPDTDGKQIGTVAFQLARKFVNESGFRALEGIGFSVVKEQGGLYHNRLVLGRQDQVATKGLMWKMLDAENAPLIEKWNWLPRNTVLCEWGTCRLQLVWQWVTESLQDTGNPMMTQGFRAGLGLLEQQGIALDQWLSSLADNMAVVVTVDPQKTVQMPQPNGKTLDLPVAAAAVLLEVKDDTIFEAVAALLEAMGGQLPVTHMDGVDLRLRSLTVPLPVPYDFSPTIARMGSYLILATSPGIVEDMNACRKGEAPRLAQAPEFQTYAQGLPKEGTGFSFLSRRYTETINDFVVTAVTQEADLAAGKVIGLLQRLQKPPASFAVTVNMPDALVSVSRTNVNLAQTMILQTGAMPMGIMAGALMPALSRARTQARATVDIANLTQLSLGVIIYADDNDGAFPKDLAELWEKGYLNTPKVFVSPAGQTPPPQSAQQLRAGQCDYLYFAPGGKITHLRKPAVTPILCTKPGILPKGVGVAYADGHVERKDIIDPELQDLIDTRNE
ncbi:MAG: hypothetical protein HQ515_18970 [Phycisphaeraceae bacterium]|nr:hypothetical protein [Phycisphaeraceae bacterium]